MFKSLVKDNNYIKGGLVKLNKLVCRAIINNYKKLIRFSLTVLKRSFVRVNGTKMGC